jgi:DNA-binding NtrC family response regulator
LKNNNKNTKFLLGIKNLQSTSNHENISFRQLKAIMVEQFERDYVTRALEIHNGNIAKAARASNKHRRAFWALMRKYQIDASQYRPDDDEE